MAENAKARRRVRDYKRISMSAGTARFLDEKLVRRTFFEHHLIKKCADSSDPCVHEITGSLYVARLLDVELTIGSKRATLTLRCPYSTLNPPAHAALLRSVARRICVFSGDTVNVHRQTSEALMRIASEITAYADRNAMQVIAESAR